MIRTTLLGAGKEKVTETNQRYIDAENDMYPPPLMTRSPTQKVTGVNKIIFPIWYFRIGRVRELLLEIQKEDNKHEFDIYFSDYYGQGLLSLISKSNHPTNVSYNNNKELYERMFITVLESLTPENLKKLFEHSLNNKNKFGRDQVTDVIRDLVDRPHMLLALWNYGLQYTKEHIELIKDPQIKAVFKKTLGKEFVTKHRYSLLNKECPISHDLINNPAICVDGYVYEHEQILEYFKQHNDSPITRQKMSCESNSLMYKNETGAWQGVEVSTKIIYVPTYNRFIHFELV